MRTLNNHVCMKSAGGPLDPTEIWTNHLNPVITKFIKIQLQINVIITGGVNCNTIIHDINS